MPRALRTAILGGGQFPILAETLRLELRLLLSATTVQTTMISGHPSMTSGPRIIASKLVGQNGFVNGISLTFDQSIPQVAASDVARYVVTQRVKTINPLGYITFLAKRTKEVVTHPFLRSADYDPSTKTVTLNFAKSVKYGGTLQVSSTNLRFSTKTHVDPKALTNLQGEPLGGRRMGGRFMITVGQKQPSSR